MASLDILCFNHFKLKIKIMKIEHKKIFRGPSKILRNISWPINICLKYFMTPTKTLHLHPPSYILMYGPLWHVSSTGCFYFDEPLLFQILVPWKFIKTLPLSCLLLLLQSTVTQITVSVNIFICFKYCTEWNGLYSEAVVWRCSVEKVFLEIS